MCCREKRTTICRENRVLVGKVRFLSRVQPPGRERLIWRTSPIEDADQGIGKSAGNEGHADPRCAITALQRQLNDNLLTMTCCVFRCPSPDPAALHGTVLALHLDRRSMTTFSRPLTLVSLNWSCLVKGQQSNRVTSSLSSQLVFTKLSKLGYEAKC